MSGKIITSSGVGTNTGLDATTQPSTTTSGASQEVSDGSPATVAVSSSSAGSSAGVSYDARAEDEKLSQAIYELSQSVAAEVTTDKLADDAVTNAKLAAPVSSISVMQIGDSLTTGSSPAPGGSRIELWRRARAAGIPLRLVGPVSQANAISTTDLRPEPGDPFCAGYPGETVSQIITRCQPGGSVHTWVASRGSPNVIFDCSGINDINAGTTAASLWALKQVQAEAYAAMCPDAQIVFETLPHFYAGSTPSGGISAANAVVDEFNTLLLSGVPSLGPQFSVVDTMSGLSRADTHTDGIHLRPEGQAKRGAKEFAHLVSLFPGAVLSADAAPRSPRIRTATAMAKFTATSDTLALSVADDGWRIPADNFLVGGCFMFATIPSVFTNLMYSAPGVQNYNHGFQLAYDGASTPKVFGFYMQGYSDTHAGGPVISKQVPNLTAGQPFWLFAHGDRSLGVVSLWCAIQEKGTDAPWTVFCLGESTGISAWGASDANPKLHLGNYVDLAHLGAVSNVVMASGVPGRDDIRHELEAMLFDGTNIEGITASLPCTEGTGSTAASNVGGQSATLTGGGWYTAGDVPRPGDDVAKSAFRNIGILCIGDSHTEGSMEARLGTTPGGGMPFIVQPAVTAADKHWTGSADGSYFPLQNAISYTGGVATQDPNIAVSSPLKPSWTAFLPAKLRGGSILFGTIRLANWGVGGSSAYTWAGEQANCYIQAVSNANDGDTVTIGSVTYTFRAAAALANEVTIGGNGTASLQNLANAINAENAGYGAGTTQHPTCFVPNNPGGGYLHLYAVSTGTAGNSIAVTTSSGGRLAIFDRNLDPGAMGGGSATSAIYAEMKTKVPAGFGTVDLVIVTLGTNDAARLGYRGRGTQTELSTLVAKIHADYPTAKIVLVKPPVSTAGGLTASSLTGTVAPAVAAVAAANPTFVVLADMTTLGAGTGDYLIVRSDDGTHLTDYGYLVEADVVSRAAITALS